MMHTTALRDIVNIVDDRILCFDPDEKDKARAFIERGFVPPGTKRYKDRRFMFDRVFAHEARQVDVYEATAQPLLNGLLDGYNTTVLAYGVCFILLEICQKSDGDLLQATGCGKTHTISGTESDPGIIYLTMADLFQRIEDRKDEWSVEVAVTFLEIYNEEIRDLLAEPGTQQPRGGLAIREDKTVKVVGLVELKPRNAQEVKEIVLQGNLRRTQSPTHANETSSRSHAVLQVHVSQSPRTASLTEQRTLATLSIIDLAGSERAAATTNMGQRMIEGANINKSLLALGNCINALCESGGAVRHVPYRNSKLTRLLKFSLGGNCKTVMIVCIAPTSAHFDDTHNTLVYAERATKIKTKVVTRNVINVDRHVGRYVEAINRLNLEVTELKEKLSGKRKTEAEIARRKAEEAKAEVERARKDVQFKVEQTKISIVDGATCSGKLSAAKTKLAAIRKRLAEITTSDAISDHIELERGLLQAMADIEEDVVKPNSALNIRLQRSSNSSAMFDATMKVVSERRSEKLDESSVELVKYETLIRRAEMEKLKAERERDAMKESMEDMAEVTVKMVGMLGQCGVIMGDAATTLRSGRDAGSEPIAVEKIGDLLQSVKQTNDATFRNLLGYSVQSYALADTSSLDTAADHFQVSNSSFTKRFTSGPAALEATDTERHISRRLSAFPPSPRRSHRTPRKSLRSSLSAQPYTRVSDKQRRGLKASKNVQWRDEAGGDLIEEQIQHQPPPRFAISVTPASPGLVDISMTPKPRPSVNESVSSFPRPPSAMGSESEWEDEDEKTNDGSNVSFLPASLASSCEDRFSLSTSRSPSSSRLSGNKRPRPSRLDPSFLKSRTKNPVLESLAEDDESSVSLGRRASPLSNLDMNVAEEGEFSLLHKNRQGFNTCPTRRRSTSPSINRPSSIGSGTKRSSAAAERRKSNGGAMRLDNPRRRSSMMHGTFDHSTANGSGIGSNEFISAGQKNSAARRVLLASPGKRKRPSLTRMFTTATKKNSIGGRASLAVPAGDPSTSMDLSYRLAKPSWR